MHLNNLLAPHSLGNAHGTKAHDDTITPTSRSAIWGPARTQPVVTTGRDVAIFILVDHATSECFSVLTKAQPHNPSWAFGELLKELHQYCIEYAKSDTHHFKTRRIPVSQFMAKDDETKRLFRTLQEHLLWLQSFSETEEPPFALDAHWKRHNEKWLTGYNGYMSPSAQHRKLLAKIAEAAQCRLSTVPEFGAQTTLAGTKPQLNSCQNPPPPQQSKNHPSIHSHHSTHARAAAQTKKVIGHAETL